MSADVATEKGYALYRFYDDGGQLLYVGITNDPARRMGQHAGSKEWWSQVRGVTLEWYPTRAGAVAAERRAVAVENPRHNIMLRRRERPAPRVVAPQKAAAPNRLIWSCKACGKPVRDRDGYIHLRMEDVYERERAMAEWDKRQEEKRQASGQPWALINMGEWMAWDKEVPEARWQVHHRACDPRPDDGDYWFDVGRARSLADLLDWVLHLHGKGWIDCTNFENFVRHALRMNNQAADA